MIERAMSVESPRIAATSFRGCDDGPSDSIRAVISPIRSRPSMSMTNRALRGMAGCGTARCPARCLMTISAHFAAPVAGTAQRRALPGGDLGGVPGRRLRRRLAVERTLARFGDGFVDRHTVGIAAAVCRGRRGRVSFDRTTQAPPALVSQPSGAGCCASPANSATLRRQLAHSRLAARGAPSISKLSRRDEPGRAPRVRAYRAQVADFSWRRSASRSRCR